VGKLATQRTVASYNCLLESEKALRSLVLAIVNKACERQTRQRTKNTGNTCVSQYSNGILKMQVLEGKK
jgi:hypothetical protein